MSAPGDGPAFPCDRIGVDELVSSLGMTLRDYFAAKAMQSMLAAYPCQAIDRQEGGIQADLESVAGDAYEMADSMLKARQA